MQLTHYQQLIAKGVLIIALAFSDIAWAKSPIYTGYFSSEAVSGYDVVAYFTEKKPVKGKDRYSTKYKGATWRFSSQEHLERFKAAPEKYAPQYGGYCAWAVAHKKTAKGDPKYWTIVNGKLYLNYNEDLHKKWLRDKENQIIKADANWPAVLK